MATPSAELDALYRPRSVAVIGASRKPSAIGRQILRNLVDYGYEGPVYPINPHAESIHSIRAYPDLASAPDPIDMVVIVIPAARVEAAVDACIAKGVRGIVVISAGFKEVGTAGQELERRVTEKVRAAGIRMIGPNCMGICNTEPEISMNATFASTSPLPGALGFMSQSGALGEAILADARTLNVGLTMFTSVGNKADVSGNDLLEYWEHDPRCKAILMYLESFGNPKHFTQLARRVSRKKPIVCVKSGRTEAGARAVKSHTGALATMDSVTDALFHQCGVIRVLTIEDMFCVAKCLSHQPLPESRRVAIVSNAGGPGILAADACVGQGLEVPELSPDVVAGLLELLPAEASVGNPVDLIASAGPDSYEHALRLVVGDETVDSVIAICIPPMMVNAEEIARRIVAATRGTKKTVVACFMGTKQGAAGAQVLERAGIPAYPYPEQAAKTVGAVARYNEWRKVPESAERRFTDVDTDGVTALLDRALADGRQVLGGALAEQIISSYGIPAARSEPVTSADQAMDVAEGLGFPVVLKGFPLGTTHKTDLDLVRLDVRDFNEVRRAYNELSERLVAHGGGTTVVQQMIKGAKELIIGVFTDPSFGPVLMFGLGGIYVETVEDVSFRTLPVTERDAEEIMAEIRGGRLLDGVRGESPVDKEVLKEYLQRLSQLVIDHPRIVEIEVNPVMASPERENCRAVDVRVVLRS
ncbi:acetate--CoA ligase family protein [Planctomycetota bacterium]